MSNKSKYTDEQLDELIGRALHVQPDPYSRIKKAEPVEADEQLGQNANASELRAVENIPAKKRPVWIYVAAAVAACAAIVVGTSFAVNYFGGVEIRPKDTQDCVTTAPINTEQTGTVTTAAPGGWFNFVNANYSQPEILGKDYSEGRTDTIINSAGDTLDLTTMPHRQGDMLYEFQVTNAKGVNYTAQLIFAQESYYYSEALPVDSLCGTFILRIRIGEKVCDEVYLSSACSGLDGMPLSVDLSQHFDSEWIDDGENQYSLVLFRMPSGEGKKLTQFFAVNDNGEIIKFTPNSDDALQKLYKAELGSGDELNISTYYTLDGSTIKDTQGTKSNYDEYALLQYTFDYTMGIIAISKTEVADIPLADNLAPEIFGYDYSQNNADTYTDIEGNTFSVADRYAHPGDVVWSKELTCGDMMYTLELVMATQCYDYGLPESAGEVHGSFVWRLKLGDTLVDETRLVSSAVSNVGMCFDMVKTSSGTALDEKYFIYSYSNSDIFLTDGDKEYSLVTFTFPIGSDGLTLASFISANDDGQLVLYGMDFEIGSGFWMSELNQFHTEYKQVLGSESNYIMKDIAFDIAKGKATEDIYSEEVVSEGYNAGQTIDYAVIEESFFGTWAADVNPTGGYTPSAETIVIDYSGDCSFNINTRPFSVYKNDKGESLMFLVSGGEGVCYYISSEKPDEMRVYAECGIGINPESEEYTAFYKRSDSSTELTGALGWLGIAKLADNHGINQGVFFENITIHNTKLNKDVEYTPLLGLILRAYPLYVISESDSQITVSTKMYQNDTVDIAADFDENGMLKGVVTADVTYTVDIADDKTTSISSAELSGLREYSCGLDNTLPTGADIISGLTAEQTRLFNNARSIADTVETGVLPGLSTEYGSDDSGYCRTYYSYDSVITELQKYFTSDFINANILSRNAIAGQSPQYINRNGELYFRDGARGENIFYIGETLKATSVTAYSIVITATESYSEDLENPKNGVYYEDYTYSLVMTDGGWRMSGYHEAATITSAVSTEFLSGARLPSDACGMAFDLLNSGSDNEEFINTAKGTNVYAVQSGTVILAEYYYGYGNCVKIDHGNGIVTLYSHLSEMNVTVGEKVAAGAVIGKAGISGQTENYGVGYDLITTAA